MDPREHEIAQLAALVRRQRDLLRRSRAWLTLTLQWVGGSYAEQAGRLLADIDRAGTVPAPEEADPLTV